MDINIYIILACLLILELSYFKIAGKFNIIDKPNLRSSHTRVTLRGGGIISFWEYGCTLRFMVFPIHIFFVG